MKEYWIPSRKVRRKHKIKSIDLIENAYHVKFTSGKVRTYDLKSFIAIFSEVAD